jgi:hypothetical protein
LRFAGQRPRSPTIVVFAAWAYNKAQQDALGGATVQTLIELIAGFIVFLAAAALSQFGVDIHSPRQVEREVHRVGECRSNASVPLLAAAPAKQRC